MVSREQIANALLKGVTEDCREDMEAVARAIASELSIPSILAMPELDRWPESYFWVKTQLLPKVLVDGKEVDFDAAVNLMDDEIREAIAEQGNFADEQAFVNAYAAHHAMKFNEVFQVA